jgi:hypothetical protein
MGYYRAMNEQAEKGPDILDAHQELVSRIEQSAGRMRALAALTVAVAALLAVAYALQLALPLTGTTSETVSLTDPALVATEVMILALTIIWLYVGLSDLRFTSRVRGEIAAAREEERRLQSRLS